MISHVAIAKQELKDWSDGDWLECVRHPTSGKPIAGIASQPGSQAVAKYWKEGLGDEQRNGCVNVAWSAAFICWCLRKSGVPLDRFPFSAGHHTYIRWAINNTKQDKPGKLFYGMRVEEYAPQTGDLIAQWRKSNPQAPDPNITFDRQPDEFYASHCDIVVSASANRITAIGGNVGDRVKTVSFAAVDGILKPNKSLIAVLCFAGGAVC